MFAYFVKGGMFWRKVELTSFVLSLKHKKVKRLVSQDPFVLKSPAIFLSFSFISFSSFPEILFFFVVVF